MKDETIFCFRCRRFDVECIQSVASLCQQIDANSLELEQALNKRAKVGSFPKMPRKRPDGQTDVGSQNCEHGNVLRADGVHHELPVLGCAELNIACCKTWDGVNPVG